MVAIILILIIAIIVYLHYKISILKDGLDEVEGDLSHAIFVQDDYTKAHIIKLIYSLEEKNINCDMCEGNLTLGIKGADYLKEGNYIILEKGEVNNANILKSIKKLEEKMEITN